MPCAIGRSGTTIRKREGDGASPVGRLAILAVRWRPERMGPLRTGLPLRATRGSDGWCDDPAHAAYNRPVRLPFPASAERMAREDRLYDAVFVLDWNSRERRRGCGSAIFLHVATPDFRPTEGCVALQPGDLRRLAPHLRAGSRLAILR